jgi:hypothetical protein
MMLLFQVFLSVVIIIIIIIVIVKCGDESKKIFNKIIWKWKILQDLKVKIFRGETENFFTKSNLTLSISLSFSVRVDPHPT